VHQLLPLEHEVIEAAEGPLASERCALGDGPCRWQAVCPLHETMAMATASLRETLVSATLAMLAERDAAIESGTYPSR
jgi:Rrf2 family transcriptional regulator, iron-sulfur cluster assembly transcription factor